MNYFNIFTILKKSFENVHENKEPVKVNANKISCYLKWFLLSSTDSPRLTSICLVTI